jgi:hypothetical protein
MRWTPIAVVVLAEISCVSAPERTPSSPASTISGGHRARALDPTPLSEENRHSSPDPPAPPRPLPRLVNTGACLEPLEPVYQLSSDRADVRRTLNLDNGALLILVAAPAFGQSRALSVHRRPNGVYFLRVMHLPPDELSPPPFHERAIDFKTARLLLELWTGLASRVQMVESEDGSFDGKAYYFSTGRVTGYAANPREGSVLDRTIFALDWLSRLVEEPTHEDPTDRDFIREELRDALTRTQAKEPCVRSVTE